MAASRFAQPFALGTHEKGAFFCPMSGSPCFIGLCVHIEQ
jgi:hypothetical protein